MRHNFSPYLKAKIAFAIIQEFMQEQYFADFDIVLSDDNIHRSFEDGPSLGFASDSRHLNMYFIAESVSEADNRSETDYSAETKYLVSIGIDDQTSLTKRSASAKDFEFLAGKINDIQVETNIENSSSDEIIFRTRSLPTAAGIIFCAFACMLPDAEGKMRLDPERLKEVEKSGIPSIANAAKRIEERLPVLIQEIIGGNLAGGPG